MSSDVSWRTRLATVVMVTGIVLVGILVPGLASPPRARADSSAWADDTGATPEGIRLVVDANNQFALELYVNTKDDEEGNIFYSPYSILMALAMTYEGARGLTAEEIQTVFHFPKDDDTRRSSLAALYNKLNKVDAKYTLSTANALWVQADYRLLDEYVTTIERYYVGKTTNVDFRMATEQARQTINRWVEDRTNNKIKDLFPQGSLDPLTRLVLTNAIYFKGMWANQFKEDETRVESFRVSEDQTVNVPMMRRTDSEAKFNYAEVENLQILEMLYEGEEMSMLILLPKNNNLASLEESLTIERLNQWRNELNEQRVDVFIPKFTFTTKCTLNGNLREMGMPSAFSPGAADFSGIDGTRNLFVQLVVHQAFVDVNEKGTEAAAATGVSIGITSVPLIPLFRADHPFMFLIQEKGTGSILFLGRVINPT